MRLLAAVLISWGAAWGAAGPVAFEPNRGQDATGADFVVYGDGFALSLRPGRADLIAGATHLSTVLAGARKPVPGVGESPLPGVDLVYYGNAGKLECDFAVAPGADPGAIRLRFEGARGLHVDAAGDLIAETASGALSQHRPVVYQDIGGARREIAGSYRIQGKTVTFAVAAYDHRRTLVIDPVLTWSTFLAYPGSTGGSLGEGVASDAAGNVYAIGTTTSTAGDADILITKFSSAGAKIFAGETTDSATFQSSLAGKLDTNGDLLFPLGRTSTVSLARTEPLMARITPTPWRWMPAGSFMSPAPPIAATSR
jgi:hypothetical protein